MTEQNKYLNGKIYKIVSNYTDDVYIGSTVDTLSSRLSKHKYDFKRHMDGKTKYITSFELLKYTEYRIELVELYPCSNKKALESREGYYIENTPNVVNKQVNGRTKKETNKAYYEINKEKVNEKHKQYYQSNKDKLSKHASEQIPCECGINVSRRNISTHRKTKNHTKLMEQLKKLKEENEYYRARIQDLIDYETNQSMVDDEYNSILDSQIDTLLSDLSESISE